MSQTLAWVKSMEAPGGGIIAWDNPRCDKTYPEVTGYLIPTLLDYGENELAQRCAHWLNTIQNVDGSWSGLDGSHATFDTAAVFEGLLSINRFYVQAFKCARAFIDRQLTTGGYYRITPDKDDSMIYNLRVNGIMGRPPNKKNEIIDRLLLFQDRSHYFAYALEGLWNLGMTDTVRYILDKVRDGRTETGLMPFYIGDDIDRLGDDIPATCQFAILYAWAGQPRPELLDAVEKYIHPNGGVPQSTTDARELSWGAKFYLDALRCYGRV